MDKHLTEPPQLPADWIDPAAEFSLCPFWFWNDTLDEHEICRQIDEFYEHGVYGFVIHPRLGLPPDTGWMSDRLLDMMRCAVQHAEKNGMWVVLYDEGMYPSGSSAGQVVAENPEYAVRGLYPRDLSPRQKTPVLEAGENLLAVVPRVNGERLAVIDRPADGVIRGLHYIGDVDPPRRPDRSTPPEEQPPAADLLNPQAVQCFLDKVYRNLMAPHAFYYSVRGPRIDESPLDVGMHSPWWSNYRQYADAVRRLCWLNTDSRCLCHVAILTEVDPLPWKAAKILQENQIDFHYLEMRDLITRARVDEHGIELSNMHYAALVTETNVSWDHMPAECTGFLEAGRLVHFNPEAPPSDLCSCSKAFLGSISTYVEPAVNFPNAQPDLRVRCILQDDEHWCLIHNEGVHMIQTAFTIPTMASPVCVDPVTLQQTPVPSERGLCFEPGRIVVLRQPN